MTAEQFSALMLRAAHVAESSDSRMLKALAKEATYHVYSVEIAMDEASTHLDILNVDFEGKNEDKND